LGVEVAGQQADARQGKEQSFHRLNVMVKVGVRLQVIAIWPAQSNCFLDYDKDLMKATQAVTGAMSGAHFVR
jgi:hypothetical protein